MELYSAEAQKLLSMAKDWMSRPDYELEATFGASGRVDSVSFMAVAQRLRAKGYNPLPQGDVLNILTPEHVRFTISSLAIVQAYCEDDTLANKPFDAVIKDRATADSKVDLDDYATRVKACREVPMSREDGTLQKMLGSWPDQRKAFRMIRRWSFDGDGIRVDMSIVRSTKKNPQSGEYRWQRRFRDQDVLKAEATYEIEVELLRKEGDTPEIAVKRLVRGIGEVLRGLQRHSILTRKSQREKVLAAYKELVGTDAFRGPSLRTLRKENFTKEREKKVPNIRDGYNVTDKADGLRTLGFVDGKGEFFLIDMGMNVYRTGLVQPELRLSLVDGEWVTKTKDRPPKPIQQFLVFDIFYAAEKRDVSQFPFKPGAVPPTAARAEGPAGEEGAAAAAPPPPEDSRYTQMNAWVAKWNAGEGPKIIASGVTTANKMNVAAKEYLWGRAGDDSIFAQAARTWAAARVYYTDGLIFTPNAAPLPKEAAATFNEQFKWKPPHDNTIDFLVRFERTKDKKEHKVTTGVRPGSGETVSYKTIRLYVGSRFDNPRDMILNKRPLPKDSYSFRGRPGKDYKPVLFTPKEFPDPYASVCNLPIVTDNDTGEIYVKTGEVGEPGEPIQDNTIVEMAYDPSEAPGWRWRPLRLRMDKTEKFNRGVLSKTLNADKVAEDVWTSIYDPITESMITRGLEEPTDAEMAMFSDGAMARELAARRYFDRKAETVDPALAKPVAKFHNYWIKERILYPAGLSGEGKHLLDLACGQGNDLHIWRRVGVNFVLGVDYAAQNIMDAKEGAWARYASKAAELGGLDRIEPMAFAIANVAKPLVNPPSGNAAGGTEEDKDILRSIFSRVKPTGSVPPFIAEEAAGRLKTNADCVSCMFAIHYFFDSEANFMGLLRNLAETLKVGGYFIGCCFDGATVFETLKEKGVGDSLVGTEGGATGKILWKITKQYEADDVLDDGGFGHGVDVLFNSIGAGHREYLVPFSVLEEKLKLVGLELLSKEELKELGLVNSTAMFEASWEMARRNGQEFKLSDTAKQFSFFNRWFIFKRKRADTMAAAVVAEAEAARAAAGTPGAAPAPGAPTAPAPANSGRAAALREAAAATAAAATALQRERAETVAKIVNGQGAAAAAAAANATGAAAAAAAVPGLNRTVPVAPGSAAAPALAAAAAKAYEPAEIFLFYADAAVKDTLRIKDKGAARWLAPSSPFPIPDPDDATVLYPTVEHYLGGQRVKRATNKPELAPTIFGREGTIHQRFLNDRLVESEGGTKPLTEERDHEYTKMELAAVKDAMRPPTLRKRGATVDEAKWATIKDEVLREALAYRWNHDARYRKIIETARNNGKTLLFYTPGASTSNVGGIYRREDGRIDGQNKMGRIMMELAGYPT